LVMESVEPSALVWAAEWERVSGLAFLNPHLYNTQFLP